MSEYEKTKCARALLYWAKNNNGHECYYLEERMYAVADGDMVILLTADSYDEAIRKAKARRMQGEWIVIKSPLSDEVIVKCPYCKDEFIGNDVEDYNFCPNCGADMRGDDNGKS